MDYSNNIIFVIIFLNNIIAFSFTAANLFSNIIKKPSSINDYRINNIWYTLSCGLFYISFFIIFLYCLRIYKIPNVLDLKIIFNLIKEFLTSFSFLFHIYIILFSMLILINIVLILLLCHKYFIHQIFCLYIFFRYNTVERAYHFDFFSGSLRKPSDSDIISYSLERLSSFIDKRLFYYFNKLSWKEKNHILSKDFKQSKILYRNYLKKRSWYHYNNLIIYIVYNYYYKKLFIPMSPILIILYDCICNNFILSHVYYYLLLYVPLMFWRRITIFLTIENDLISSLIWDILYKNENCIYALPLKHKILFDLYIANGFKSIPISKGVEQDLYGSMYIQEASRFIYNKQKNHYENSENVIICDPLDNKLNDRIKVIIWVNLEIHYEAWYIIANKTILS